MNFFFPVCRRIRIKFTNCSFGACRPAAPGFIDSHRRWPDKRRGALPRRDKIAKGNGCSPALRPPRLGAQYQAKLIGGRISAGEFVEREIDGFAPPPGFD
jgi:hypothetical protein